MTTFMSLGRLLRDMNVLVVGGTGFVGQSLCRELHERGHTVAAMGRTPGGADLPEGVETVRGDVTAYDSIRSAFDGRDAVVNLVALSPLYRQPSGRHLAVHYEGTENVIRACEDADVPRLIQMSANDADPDADTEYLRAKGRAEEAVRGSDLDHVVFRPSVIFGEGGEFISFTRKVTPGPIAPLPGANTSRFQPIWIEDLVAMMADAVEDDAHTGETYEIGGPEVYTLAEVTKLAHGGSFTPIPMPLALADIGFGILGAIGGPFGRDQARSLRIDNVIEDNDVSAFGVDGRDLRTLPDYLGVDPRAVE
jgi:NADH dehydrogenase